MIALVIGIAIGATAMLPALVYLYRCNAPLRADARVGRARLAAIARDQANRKAKRRAAQ